MKIPYFLLTLPTWMIISSNMWGMFKQMWHDFVMWLGWGLLCSLCKELRFNKSPGGISDGVSLLSPLVPTRAGYWLDNHSLWHFRKGLFLPGWESRDSCEHTRRCHYVCLARTKPNGVTWKLSLQNCHCGRIDCLLGYPCQTQPNLHSIGHKIFFVR